MVVCLVQSRITINARTLGSGCKLPPSLVFLKHAPMCAQSLHYGMGCFEGMKAYAGSVDGLGRLFRPDMNMARLQRSQRRLMMADFDAEVSWDRVQPLRCDGFLDPMLKESGRQCVVPHHQKADAQRVAALADAAPC